MQTEIPRRSRVDLFTPAETAIFEAAIAVEKVGAHPLLTEAVILLGQARDKVADYVEGAKMEVKTLPVLTTLEDYLKSNIKEGCEFRLVIKNSVDGNVETPEFYISTRLTEMEALLITRCLVTHWNAFQE